MTPFECSVAFWLRAYPRRWREARASEVTAVLADLAGPGARRLGARAALGLVAAGWATRWRERPPLMMWLEYRLLARPMPRRYRAWVRDDIEAPGYPLRVQAFIIVLVAAAQYWGGQDPDLPFRAAFHAVGVVPVVVLVVSWRRVRHHARVRHLGAAYAERHRASRS